MPSAASHPSTDQASQPVRVQGSSRDVIGRSLRLALIVSAVCAVALVIVQWVAFGVEAARAGFIGAVIAVLAMWSGSVVVRSLLRSAGRGLTGIGIVFFFTHLGLLAVVCIAVARVVDLDGPALAAGALVAVIAYQVGLSAGVLRGRTLIVEPPESGDTGAPQRDQGAV